MTSAPTLGQNDDYDPEDGNALPFATFWREPSPEKFCDVMISSRKLRVFKDDLKKLDLKFNIMIRSVHNLILKQSGINRKATEHLTKHDEHDMTWDSYKLVY